MPRETPEITSADPKETVRRESESQEKTSKRRRPKKLRNKLNNRHQLLSRLKSKKQLLPRERAEGEEAEKVNNDLFKLINFLSFN